MATDLEKFRFTWQKKCQIIQITSQLPKYSVSTTYKTFPNYFWVTDSMGLQIYKATGLKPGKNSKTIFENVS